MERLEKSYWALVHFRKFKMYISSLQLLGRIPVIKDLTLKILEQKISSNKEIKLLEVFS